MRAGPYAAFISYARRRDAELAVALQSALEQFGKSWYRRSALRIFRDDASLAANPDLWLSLQAALDKSDHLVLLASPAAARSDWIAREVSYWLEHKDPDDILIAVTEGKLGGAPPRDGATRDVSPWIEILPPVLADRYTDTSPPRVVDLRGLHPQQLSLQDPTFREKLMDLAAPLHGRGKEDLRGEDDRQHTRRIRAIRVAVALLVTLVLVATTTAVVAFNERSKALRQLDIATSIQLASQSEVVAATSPQLAILLSVAAAHILDTSESRAAMAHQLQRSAYVVRFFGDGAVPGRRIKFGVDGRTLLYSDTSGSRSWDLTTRRSVPLLPDGTDVELTGFSKSRRMGVIDRRGPNYHAEGLDLVDIASGARTDLPDAQGPGVFSPDDKILATASKPLPGSSIMNSPVILWDVATHTRLQTLPPDAGGSPWAFSPDGRILALSPGVDADVADVILWDVVGRKKLAVLNGGHGRGVLSLVFSPDGMTIATGGHDARIVLWDVPSGARRMSWTTRGDVNSLAFTDDGKSIVSGDENREVILWDAMTGSSRQSFAGHLFAVTGVDTAGDLAASVDQNGQVIVWGLAARDWLSSGRIPGPAIPTAFGRDGEFLSTTDPPGTILSVWRTSTQALVDVKPAGVLSPDWSTLFVTGAVPANVATTIVTDKVADPGNALELRVDALAGAGIPLGVSPDRRFLVARNPNQPGVVIWDVERRLPDDTLAETVIGSIAFSPDSRFIALAGVDSIIIWDTQRRVRVREIPQPGSYEFVDIAFSPDGTRLLWTNNYSAVTSIGCSGCYVTVWALDRNAVVSQLTGHRSTPSSVVFSSDGRMIASAGGGVILWSADRLTPIVELPAANGRVLFNPAGTMLATGGVDDAVHLWDVSPQSWKAKLCAIAGRSLSTAEWTAYLGDRPYEDVCAG